MKWPVSLHIKLLWNRSSNLICRETINWTCFSESWANFSFIRFVSYLIWTWLYDVDEIVEWRKNDKWNKFIVFDRLTCLKLEHYHYGRAYYFILTIDKRTFSVLILVLWILWDVQTNKLNPCAEKRKSNVKHKTYDNF